jgi:hypothetical protein
MIIIVRLLDEMDRATKIFPDEINNVVSNEPGIVPNLSMNIPPIKGNTVLTIATLD